MVCHLLKNPLKPLIFPLLFINATFVFNTRYVFMFLNEYFLTHVVKSLVYYLESFSLFPWMDFFVVFLTHIPTHIIFSFLYFPFYIFFLISVSIPGYFCHYYAA